MPGEGNRNLPPAGFALRQQPRLALAMSEQENFKKTGDQNFRSHRSYRSKASREFKEIIENQGFLKELHGVAAVAAEPAALLLAAPGIRNSQASR